MEKKFYTDDFEQFLKETADDFRMYPSKQVWNSLYNNLHPGRKWPSLSVCLLLVSSIIFIGLSHKNEITGSTNLVKKEITTPLIAYESQDAGIKQVEFVPAISPVKSPVGVVSRHALAHSASITQTRHKKQVLPITNTNLAGTNNIQSTGNNTNEADHTQDYASRVNNTVSNPVSNTVNAPDPTQLSNSLANNNTVPEDKDDKADETVLEKSNTEISLANNTEKVAGKNITEIKPSIKELLLTPVKNNGSTEDKDWIEDYAFHNQPLSSLKSKLAYEFYITPSIGYRTLAKNISYDLPARPALTGTSTSNTSNVLIQTPGLNLEAGYNYIYSYSKSMRIKAGVQLNYTNYRIHAHQLGHSTLATLLLNDPSGGIELSQRSSSLSNLSSDGSDKKLNSSTFQVSLPIGADMKIAGKHNFQWFAGATLQPTYVLFGNAYLISSDAKNYVYDATFLRKWNINGGIETFLSYKTKNGITFNAGPQFRYQFFSTYKKKYSYDEKLYNVGMKIGMIRNF